MLPDDVLADVLRRLTPRGLAASRCVCTAWRELIDDRRLLRTDLLPCSLAGLFINYDAPEFNFAEFFSRPSAEPVSYPRNTWVEDHCNGLLLLYDGVLNPATGWWVPLPECPPPPMGMWYFIQDKYLVFDPTVSSSDYEVFSIPRLPCKDYTDEEIEELGLYHLKDLRVDGALLGSSWPLSPCILNVLSSKTGRWEKRSFDRDGEAAGIVADLQLDNRIALRRRNAVYCRGALYVHCENDFVMRISFSTNKYHMIKPPKVISRHIEFYLGKSGNGVHYGIIDDDDRLRVWILAEPSSGQIEWILKHDSGSSLLLPSLNCIQRAHGPWILRDFSSGKGDKNAAVITEHNKSDWNSDDESILYNEDSGQSRDSGGYLYLEILGFHPFKDILFLQRSSKRGLVYHLNSSRLEDLGDLRPENLSINEIGPSLPYIPCRI